MTGQSFLRDIVSQRTTPDGFATEVVLSCGHEAILIGTMDHLIAMYGRLASQCADCLEQWVREQREQEQ